MIRPLLSTIQSHTPRTRSLVLGLLIVATLVMPVSYRAGADDTHAHTIFQGVIDLITGHPHQHSTSEIPEEPASTSAIFSPLPTSLLVAGGQVDHVEPPLEPDVPQLLGMSMPISAFATINDLRILLLTLLTSVMVGQVWISLSDLRGIPSPVATPPPRIAG